MTPEPLTYLLIGAGIALALERLFGWLARHEENRYRRSAQTYDGDGWERRHCHLHLVHSAPSALGPFDQDADAPTAYSGDRSPA